MRNILADKLQDWKEKKENKEVVVQEVEQPSWDFWLGTRLRGWEAIEHGFQDQWSHKAVFLMSEDFSGIWMVLKEKNTKRDQYFRSITLWGNANVYVHVIDEGSRINVVLTGYYILSLDFITGGTIVESRGGKVTVFQFVLDSKPYRCLEWVSFIAKWGFRSYIKRRLNKRCFWLENFTDSSETS